MSEYRKTETKFTDKDILIDSLVAAGYDRSVIEVHETAQQLYDYHGSPTRYTDNAGDKANIIIRRHHLGYSSGNDIGFKYDPVTKTYTGMISDYDSGNGQWGPESPRMKATEVAYGDLKTKKTLLRNGFKFLGKEMVNGRLQVKYLDLRA
jgi:hypothetical protein